MASTKALLVVLGVSLVASSTAQGGTLQAKSLQQLIDGADLIVRGQVQAVTPGPPWEGAPGTTIAISVQEQWKGTSLSTLRLVQPQGTERGITQEVPGLPTFRLEEEVILFVVREARGEYRVLGGKQGKFSIKTDPRSGKQVVEDLAGAQFDLTQFVSGLRARMKTAP